MTSPAFYNFKVKTMEIDCRHRMNVPAIANMIQDAAWRHASQLGVSSYELMKTGVTWVLSKFKIEILENPGHESELTVKTWPSGGDKYHAYRGFIIQNEQQELLVKAASIWLIIDVAKREITQIPDYIKSLRCEEEDAGYNFTGNIPDVTEAQFLYKTKVCWHDLDINRHVNNNHYIRWALESFPEQHLYERDLKSLEIVFRGEGGYGDEIESASQFIDKNQYLHNVHTADGRELIRAISVWNEHVRL